MLQFRLAIRSIVWDLAYTELAVMTMHNNIICKPLKQVVPNVNTNLYDGLTEVCHLNKKKRR